MKWIRVTDQLPRGGEEVVAYDCYHKDIGIASLYLGRLVFCDTDDCLITHWMPLPPPPSKEEIDARGVRLHRPDGYFEPYGNGDNAYDLVMAPEKVKLYLNIGPGPDHITFGSTDEYTSNARRLHAEMQRIKINRR